MTLQWHRHPSWKAPGKRRGGEGNQNTVYALIDNRVWVPVSRCPRYEVRKVAAGPQPPRPGLANRDYEAPGWELWLCTEAGNGYLGWYPTLAAAKIRAQDHFDMLHAGSPWVQESAALLHRVGWKKLPHPPWKETV